MTIYELKEKGHDLIAELQELGMRLNGHRGVYSVLRRRLKVPQDKAHFRNMLKESEVLAAVAELEIMLINRKRQKYPHLRPQDIIPHEKRTEAYLPDVYLPREEVLKALQSLDKNRIHPSDDKVWIVKTL